MSGIALSHFLEIARLGTDGEVRMASGDVGKVLVNKGMLEHRLGTWLGMGDASTRDERNSTAVEAFRQALTRRFGAGNAEQALELAGYAEGTALTGRVIVDAHRHAGHLEQDNVANNHRILERTEIVHGDQNVVDAFATRFAENLRASTRNYRDALDPDALKALTETTAKKVIDLQNAGRLEEANDARKALSDAMQRVLTSIANKEKPDVLLARLMDVRNKQKVLGDIEGEAEEQGGQRHLNLRAATFDALAKLGTRYPEFVEDVRRRGLSDSSSLRALYRAVDQALETAGLTGCQEREAEALKDQCEALINDLVAAGRPHTESQTGDITLLQKGDTVEDKQLGLARGAVNRMLGTESMTLSQFVDFANQAPDDEIGWIAGQLIKPNPEEAEVTTGAALAQFEETLAGQYGKRIARQALEHAFQNQTVFNGTVVIEAEKHVLVLVEENRDVYREIIEIHRKDGDEEPGSTYNHRFKHVLEARSDGFHRSLTEGLGPDDTREQAQKLAVEVEDQVSKLFDRDLLEASSKARQQLSAALLDAVTAIVNRPDLDAVERRLEQNVRKKRQNFEQVKDLLDDVPEKLHRQETTFLFAKLLKVDRCLTALQDIEAETGPQTGEEKLQIVTIDALRRFVYASGDNFFHLFDKGKLSESSPFRALYAAAREVAEDHDAPEPKRERARALMAQWEQLARTFVAMTTPNTRTRTDTLKHLLDGPVDELRLETARHSLALHLEPLGET